VADGTHIEWSDATWNPLVGCTKVSAGCDNCYAEGVVNRWHAAGKPSFPNRFDVVSLRRNGLLYLPLRWTRPRKVFVNSLADLFHADVPDDFIARVFAIMALSPLHTFQLLTKRHARMRALLSDDGFRSEVAHEINGLVVTDGVPDAAYLHDVDDWWPLPHVWLGVSVEDQHWAHIRIPALLDTPAAVRWISAEPLLGPLHLRPYLRPRPWYLDATRLDWVVTGGESGPGARPMHRAWARLIADQCARTGVPFLHKQNGVYVPDPDGTHVPVDSAGREWPGRMRRVPKQTAGRELDGRTYDGFPRMPVVAR